MESRSRRIHEAFPSDGVSIAGLFKDFFVDEWSSEPDAELMSVIEAALGSTVEPVLEELRRL